LFKTFNYRITPAPSGRPHHFQFFSLCSTACTVTLNLTAQIETFSLQTSYFHPRRTLSPLHNHIDFSLSRMPIPPNPISSSRSSSERRQLQKSYTISTQQPVKDRPLFRRVSSSVYSSSPSILPSSRESHSSPGRGTHCLSCPEAEHKLTSSWSEASSPYSLSSNSLSLRLVNGGWNRVIRGNGFFFYVVSLSWV